jgi:glycosyltransferase involved in cell wall biosynthesis
MDGKIQMISVLHTESSTGWGGQENRTLKESIGLKKLGARVIILCQPGSMIGKIAAAEGIDVKTCRMRKHYDLPAISLIMKLIVSEQIDVISTHSGRDSFLAGAAGRLSRRQPVIVRTRHIALPITTRFTYSVLPHKVVTTSEYVRRYLISAGIGPERVVAVHTGIDLSKFDPDNTPAALRHELGLGAGVPVVGTVSILRFKKGHQTLLKAIPMVLEKIPEAVFVFAGDGPQRENISNAIKKSGLSGKVFMLGLRQDIPSILNSIDVFVLPTLEEAHGGVYVEAMAMRKPVIGTDVGGVSEVIKHGINGLLIEPDNAGVLAEAIIQMLGNKNAMAAFGAEGRKMVEAQFSTEKMCERMYALYGEMLQGRSR